MAFKRAGVLSDAPRHKTDTCRKKILEELIFARIHVGPVFALVRIQENIFEELFLKYVFALWPCPLYSYSACIRISLVPIHKNIFGELISVQIHAAHVFTPGRIQENIPGELFMYWLRIRPPCTGAKNRIRNVLVSCQGVLFLQRVAVSRPKATCAGPLLTAYVVKFGC